MVKMLPYGIFPDLQIYYITAIVQLNAENNCKTNLDALPTHV
jgi:hypothetical protein